MKAKAARRLVFIAASLLVLAGCLCEPCSKARRNEETVRLAVETIVAGDYDALDRFFTEDYVRHCQATPDIPEANLEQFKAFLIADRGAVPDQSIEEVHLFAQGDLVAYWGVYRGTHLGQMGPFPPTGRSFELDFSGVHRLVGGKIAETWVTWDNLSMLNQLGLFPPPAAEAGEPAVDVS